MARLKLAVLISGRGSNLQALIEACRDPAYPAEIALVVSNEPDALGLERAKAAKIPTRVVNHRDFSDRAAFEAQLSAAIETAGARLVCLAGFMRLLGGEFVLDRRFGFRDGLMGGNLWFMGRDLDAALLAAERGTAAVARVPGVILPFPGGIAASGSKTGSRYSFSIASTYEKFCPTLRERLGDQSGVPDGVGSIMEIIINGRDVAAIVAATQAAIRASVDTPGLVKISAGNYGGRLGKSFIYLHPEKQPA